MAAGGSGRARAHRRRRLPGLPARLPEQPIFYPVLTQEYAVQIARDWNVPQSEAGFVTRFRVRSAFLARYEVHQVGDRHHREY